MNRRPAPDPDKVRAIVEELRGELDEEDHEKLEKLVAAYTYVTDLIRDDDMTIDRLRTLVKKNVRIRGGETRRR